MENVERVLTLGVTRVIIGSAAISDPEFVKNAVLRYGNAVAVGIDARGGTVRTDAGYATQEKTILRSQSKWNQSE